MWFCSLEQMLLHLLVLPNVSTTVLGLLEVVAYLLSIVLASLMWFEGILVSNVTFDFFIREVEFFVLSVTMSVFNFFILSAISIWLQFLYQYWYLQDGDWRWSWQQRQRQRWGGYTNSADGAVARTGVRVPGGYGPASDASAGDAVVGKVATAAAPTGWEDRSNPAIVICQQKILWGKSSVHCFWMLTKVRGSPVQTG